MNLPADRDQLTRAEAAALFAELQTRAAVVRMPSTRSRRRGRRRWAALAPAVAILVVAGALIARPLTAGGPPASGTDLAALGIPRVPGQQVKSIAHQGLTSTVIYRSGLIEVVGPSRGGITNGVMTPGAVSVAVEIGGHRVLLSGLNPALLHRIAAALVSRGGSSPSPSPTPSTPQVAP